MHNEKKGKIKGLFMGLLGGAAAGSIITLLFAPKSGKELQKDIKTKSQDFIEDIEQYIAKTKDNVSRLIHDGKNKSGEMADDTMEKVNSLLSETEKLLNEVKEQAANIGSRGMKKFEKEIERLKTAIKSALETYNKGK